MSNDEVYEEDNILDENGEFICVGKWNKDKKVIEFTERKEEEKQSQEEEEEEYEDELSDLE